MIYSSSEMRKKKHSKNDNLKSGKQFFKLFFLPSNRYMPEQKKKSHPATLEWSHKTHTHTLRYVAFQFLTDANLIIVLDDLPLCTTLTNLPRQISRFCDKPQPNRTRLKSMHTHTYQFFKNKTEKNLPIL